MYKYNLFTIVSGGERTGKTFFASNLCSAITQKTGKITLAYNKMLEDDFAGFEEIQFLGIEETANMIQSKNRKQLYLSKPDVIYFTYKNSMYHMRDFFKILKGKKVFSRRMYINDEDYLFRALHKYAGYTQLIIDDSKSIFRDGLKKGMTELFQSKAHAGYMSSVEGLKGIDIYAVFHNLDAVNSRIWDYATTILLFYTLRAPKLNLLDNDEAKEIILDASLKLKNEPVRTCYQINLKGYEDINYIKYTPDYIVKIAENC